MKRISKFHLHVRYAWKSLFTRYYELIFVFQITKSRLTLPCTGVNCTHLSFFNGDSFLSMNHSRDDWSCPICRIPIGMDQLRVDTLLKKILMESNPQTTQVSFDRNAKWSEHVECKKEIVKEATSSSGANKKTAIDIITIDDSEDEASASEPAPQPPCTASTSASDAGRKPLTIKIKNPQATQVSSRESSNSSSSSTDTDSPSPRRNGNRKRGHSPDSSEDEDEEEDDEEGRNDWESDESCESEQTSTYESSESSQSSSPSSPVISRLRNKSTPARRRARR